MRNEDAKRFPKSSVRTEHRNWLLLIAILLFAELSLLASIQLQFGMQRWFTIVPNVGDAAEYLTLNLFIYHMPFYSLLIALMKPLLSPVEAAIVVNAISFLGFGSTIYLMTRRLWIGLVASFFPYFIFKYTMFAFADISALLFTVLSFYFLTKNRLIWGLLFGTLAVATHYIALFLVPGFLYCAYRVRPRYMLAGLVPSTPFVVLSILRLFVNKDILYYFRIPWAYSQAYFGGGQYGFLSFPFASVVYVITHMPTLLVKGLAVNTYYAVVIFFPVYAIYWFGAYVAYRKLAYLEMAWGLPLLLFLTCITPSGFSEVPRYVVYAFPLLIRAAVFSETKRPLQILIILVTTGNIAYAFVSLLLVPFARLSPLSP